MTTLRQLMLDETSTRLASEILLISGMQAMGEAATCVPLQNLFRLQTEQAEGRVGKLGSVFRDMGEQSVAGSCEVTVKLLDACHQTAATLAGSPALNAALVCAVRKVRHHEIASYSCLHDWAALLGQRNAAGMFEEFLHEGEAADASLAGLSRMHCNRDALGPEGDAGSTSDAFGHIIGSVAA